MTRQLPLSLDARRESHAREDLVVGAANAEALAWIDSWRDWPAPALVLWGPEGSGKSHLASIWATESGAQRVAIGVAAEAASTAPALLIEDVDAAIAGDAAERALLHAYNIVAEARGRLLLTARTPPARWIVGLADLRSRMQALPATELRAPDDAMLEAVLAKLFADRQLPPDAELLQFVAARIERRYALLPLVAETLDRAALAARRAITVPFAREVLRAEGLID